MPRWSKKRRRIGRRCRAICRCAGLAAPLEASAASGVRSAIQALRIGDPAEAEVRAPKGHTAGTAATAGLPLPGVAAMALVAHGQAQARRARQA